MPDKPPLAPGPEIIILRDDATGEFKVRLAFPLPDGEYYAITMTGELALLVSDSIRFAALSAMHATNPNRSLQA